MMYEGNATNCSVTGSLCDILLDSMTVKFAKTVAWCIMLVLAVVGNCLVVTVLYRKPKLRTVINLFILNMAISDLILPVFAFPVFIKGIYHQIGEVLIEGAIGAFFCKFIPFVSGTSLVVSFVTLAIIAIERFFGVVFPMVRQPLASKKRCCSAIALTWVIGIVYSSQFFYTHRIVHGKNGEYCTYSWSPAFDTKEAVKVELIVYYICFTAVPFMLMTVLYVAIMVALNKGKANLGNEQNRRIAKENKLVAFMLMSTTAVCILTWIPSNVYIFITVFIWNSASPCNLRHFRYIAHFLGYCNSAANPFIYYIFNQHYRKGINEIICCRKNRNAVQE